MAMWLLLGPAPSLAAESGAVAEPPRMQTGEVTGTAPDGIIVDQQRYPVLPNAEVQTDEGKPRKLADLRPGEIVQYRLKRGMIDRIVVISRK
jgi:hypothetical protein